MKYRTNPKNGDEISLLAFGCMRFPSDDKLMEKQVISAIEQGVNYFDTAYIYPNSEARLGKVLSKGYRDRVKIATKMPHYLAKNSSDFDKFFNTELQRLQTDRIDYYLMHMLGSPDDWRRLVSIGAVDWIIEKKRSGQIINIGFSFHGGSKQFKDILDAYNWDFCMIQYNYLDEFNQAGRSGLEYAGKKGIPVMIMEPLRGGRLVTNLPKAAEDLFAAAAPGRSNAEWGLRWVMNHPEVLTVLSGMNSMEMIAENVRVASAMEPGILTDAELEVCAKVREIILSTTKVNCTGCGYCMPCPSGVDIPTTFACYNDTALNGMSSHFFYFARTGGCGPDKCVGCGLCEKHCPQGIPIREKLAETKKKMEGFPYNIVKALYKRVYKR